MQIAVTLREEIILFLKGCGTGYKRILASYFPNLCLYIFDNYSNSI